MANYSYYPTTYAGHESENSSPLSRDFDFEHHSPPWEDSIPTPPTNYKVKFMCSYAGKIQPRTHDNQLSYIGGDTKIFSVDRNIKFSGIVSKLSSLSGIVDFTFKYQLPGEDLDALISVTNDEDLEHLMHEVDRLNRASAKPARMRLFLFPMAVSVQQLQQLRSSEPEEFRSIEVKPDLQSLNSGPVQTIDNMLQTETGLSNVDFLFGLGKSDKLFNDRVAEPVAPVDFVTELEEQRSTDGDFYGTKFEENLSSKAVPVTLPVSNLPPAYYHPANQIANTGGLPATVTNMPIQEQQQMYMIQPPSGMYHANMARQITGQAGQGYYAVQRIAPDYYREQQQQPPVYNAIPQHLASPPPQVPAAPHRMAVYSDGLNMMRPNATAGVTDKGIYTQVAYDKSGRQVYYATQGGVVTQAQQYHGIAAVNEGDMRTAGAVGHDGK